MNSGKHVPQLPFKSPQEFVLDLEIPGLEIGVSSQQPSVVKIFKTLIRGPYSSVTL
jgi:hypothetical protein